MGSEPHKILHIETEFLVWFVVILRANTLMAFLWSSHMTDKSQLKKRELSGQESVYVDCRRYEFSVGTGSDIYLSTHFMF